MDDEEHAMSDSNDNSETVVTVTHRRGNVEDSLVTAFTSRGGPSHHSSVRSTAMINVNKLAVMLSHRGTPVEKLADDWYSTFTKSWPEALRSFLQLILHTTGWQVELNTNTALQITLLTTEKFDAKMLNKRHALPLMPDDTFQDNLFKFITLSMKVDVLKNAEFMKQVDSMLNVMRNSQWTSARFIALVYGADISITCLMLWKQTYAMAHNLQSRDSLRFNYYLEDIQTTISTIYTSFTILFDKILQCLRDQDLLIRKFAFTVLRDVVMSKPKLFMTKLYLRHFVYGIVDESPAIRIMNIKACAEVVCSTQFRVVIVSEAQWFMDTVLHTLLVRTRDKSTNVAVEAIRACALIYRSTLQLFRMVDEKVNPEAIYKLVYCNRPAVQAAAGLFLYSQIMTESEESEHCIIELADFLNESEVYQAVTEVCVEELVRAMFAHAEEQLTDWPAWLRVLQAEGDKHTAHRPLTLCRLLLQVIQHATSLGSQPHKNEIMAARNKKSKARSEKHANDLTRELGPHLFTLWKKYQNRNDCLQFLISIPHHFSGDIDDVDVKPLILFLARLVFEDDVMAEKCYILLAHLVGLMDKSDKWRPHIPFLKKKFILPALHFFMQFIARIVDNDPHMDASSGVLKRAYFVTKYFDISNTEFNDHLLPVLRFSIARNNVEVFLCVAPMCLFGLQWQLANIFNTHHSKEEHKALQYKMLSHTRTLVNVLTHLAMTTSLSLEAVLNTTLSVLTQVHLQFSSFWGKHFPFILLPKPDSYLIEWLSFRLKEKLPWEKVPSGADFEYFEGVQTLTKFCLLITTRTIPLMYLDNVLPYFKFYNEDVNYNSVLEAHVTKLAQRPLFYFEVFQGLWQFNKQKKLTNIEMVCEGLCEIICKKEPEDKTFFLQIRSIVKLAIVEVIRVQDFSFLKVMTPFVAVLSKDTLQEIELVALDRLRWYTNNKFVRYFIFAIRKRTRHIRQPKPAPRKDEDGQLLEVSLENEEQEVDEPHQQGSNSEDEKDQESSSEDSDNEIWSELEFSSESEGHPMEDGG